MKNCSVLFLRRPVESWTQPNNRITVDETEHKTVHSNATDSDVVLINSEAYL